MNIQDYFIDADWKIVHTSHIPEKNGQFCQFTDLRLSKQARQFLSHFKQGIYRHQKIAIQEFLNNSHICLSTSTSSGKSLVFYVCAIERIVNYIPSKILAIYPLKALAKEQEERWKDALGKAELPISVARIDGGVPKNKRMELLHESQVLLMTPDIMHAWLLSNVHDRQVSTFLQQITLIIVDEAHTYSGVFGSNSAFLFRRMHYFIKKLGGEPSYIAASATIRNSEIHLKSLFGIEDFTIIDQRFESMPKKATHILMVEPPFNVHPIEALSELVAFIAHNTEEQLVVVSCK